MPVQVIRGMAKTKSKGSAIADSEGPTNILVVDIGGTGVKLMRTGETKRRRFSSGGEMTPEKMMASIAENTKGWSYEAVSIGYPGRVSRSGPQSEPLALGRGWVGFDFGAAFKCPVRIVNDACMQAIGSYDGGRMLFIGLGTGIGSTLIVDNVVVALELGELPVRRRKTLWQLLGAEGLRALGRRAWRKEVSYVTERLAAAFNVDYIVIGGGNAELIKRPPTATRLGNNLAAFRGGFRLWNREMGTAEALDAHLAVSASLPMFEIAPDPAPQSTAAPAKSPKLPKPSKRNTRGK